MSGVLPDIDTTATNVSTELYEDDGTTLLHADGAYRLHAITHTCNGKGLRTVSVSAVDIQSGIVVLQVIVTL